MNLHVLAFIIAILPVALSPGASFTLAINNTLVAGARGLAAIILGTALGIYTHALLIGLGISALPLICCGSAYSCCVEAVIFPNLSPLIAVPAWALKMPG